MAEILITEDGKRVQIDTYNDLKLYQAPENPPNTGSTYTRGTDLHAHKTRKGNWYYYTHFWSMWQGQEENTELISKEDAILFLQKKAALGGHACMSSREMKQVNEHFGIDIFEEDA